MLHKPSTSPTSHMVKHIYANLLLTALLHHLAPISYGLKRTPRYFYDLAVKMLESIGIHRHPYSLCLFYGSPIPGQPPLSFVIICWKFQPQNVRMVTTSVCLSSPQKMTKIELGGKNLKCLPAGLQFKEILVV